MDAEIVRLAEQAGPCLSAALAAYGGAVLTRAETASADATANLGRRLLQLVWHRRTPEQQADLEAAVADASADPADADALAALRQLLKRALRDDPALRDEVAALLPAGQVTVTASGERSIAAQHLDGIAVTGDSATIRE
ncbi:hypothetical protein AB0M28_37510 [Streptomyces sp. NPDC051940]|uniref:hypothetical protein n=1 Tax=Streptomyces sp. NPDC051940 TaxID=3155675 RepID=UPI00343FA01B